jgi:hypothetical protein
VGHFTSLKESTSQEAQEIHTLITIHPAFSFIRTSYLYDTVYIRFRETTDNLSEARIRTVLHMLHIMDEIAKAIGIMNAATSNSVPEHLFHLAFSEPKYKAYSPLVTHESRLRQEQRRKKAAKDRISKEVESESTDHLFKPKPVPKEEIAANQSLNEITNILARRKD